MLLKLFENRLIAAPSEGENEVLRLANDEPVSADDIRAASPEVIELTFPAYKDGRAFTQARELREKIGYQGELRAAGEILRDQILFMVRCGFTSFEIADGTDIEGLNEALSEFSFFYQTAVQRQMPVWLLRRDAAQPARKIA